MIVCKNCGKELRYSEKFCTQCGCSAENNEIRKEKQNIMCALAYLGTLFWFPLVFDSKNKDSRKCANQGLWILILSFAACTLLQIVEKLYAVIKGSMLLSVFGFSIYAIVYMLFIVFMSFLLINCIKGMQAEFEGKEPHILPIFGKYKIIPEK